MPENAAHDRILAHVAGCSACRARIIAMEMSRRGSRSLETMTAEARRDRATAAQDARHRESPTRRRRDGLARLLSRTGDQTTDTTGLSPFEQRARARLAAEQEARRRAQETADD
jgi:hypothetical protein